MGWQDRPYYHDRSSSENPLTWLASASMPMFTIRGIRFRAHLTLLIFVTAILVLGGGWDALALLGSRFIAMGILVASLILHEMAHCYVSRRLGGHADEILIWPVGGLENVDPPHRPLSEFLTALAGPAFNFSVCIFSAMFVLVFAPRSSDPLAAHFSFDPRRFMPPSAWNYSNPAYYFWWCFHVNYALLVINLIPVHPLDGGQMLQTALWPALGNFRSRLTSSGIGIAVSIIGSLASLVCAVWAWPLIFLFMYTFYDCYQRRLVVHENGPEEWGESLGFGDNFFDRPEPVRRRRLSRRVIHKARRIAASEAAARQHIENILAKVSAKGLPSLNFFERRALHKATQKQRRSETELSRFQ
jgi:Zn-dependent protease